MEPDGIVLLALGLADPEVAVGDAAWADLHVENRSGARTAWCARPDSLAVTAAHADGVAAPGIARPEATARRPTGECVELEPGRSATVRLDLAAWVWLDRPGDHVVTALLDGSTATATLRVTNAGDPLATVLRHPWDPLGDPDPTRPDRGEALGHAFLVPTLAGLLLASDQRDLPAGSWPELDRRASVGLSSCLCSEANDVLLELHALPAELVSSAFHEHVAALLLQRILHAPFDATFTPDQHATLRERALTELEAATTQWAAHVLARVPDPVGARVAAAELVLARPDDRAKEAALALLRRALPAEIPADASPAYRLAVALDPGRRGELPDDVVLAALADGPLSGALAVRRVSPDAGPAVVAAMIASLASPTGEDPGAWGPPTPEAGLRREVLAGLGRLRDPAAVGALDRVLASGPGGDVGAAAAALGGIRPLPAILGALLARLDRDPDPTIARALSGLGIRCSRGGGVDGAAELDVASLVAAWREALRTRGAELAEGPLVTGPGDAPLLGAGRHCDGVVGR